MGSAVSGTAGRIPTGAAREPLLAGGPLRALLPVLLATAAVPVFAQQGDPACAPAPEGGQREIRSGQCVRSVIEDSDPKNPDGVPYEDWHLRLAAGQAVQIDMDAVPPPPTPPAPAPAPAQPAPAADAPDAAAADAPDDFGPYAFDTYLELRLGSTIVAYNDDRGGSLDSTIRFTAAQAGDYVVRARPLFSGRGEYTLRISELAPVVPVALVPGANTIAPPAAGGAELQERLFTFTGRTGQRVRLALARPGFATQLRLLDPEGNVIAAAGESDRELDVQAILPRPGLYRVEALLNDFGAAQPPVTLRFETAEPPPERRPRRIRTGDTVQGELGLNSPAARDSYGGGTMILNELYELRLREGQTVTIFVDSQAFDPVIDAGALSALGFAAAQTDDDGGAGLGSRLVLQPERSGAIVLRVRALGNRTGPFRLRVLEGQVPAEGD